MTIPNCPQCGSEYCYEDRDGITCPECGHSWQPAEESTETVSVKDANGTPLFDGDDVIIMKDLKVKGSATAIKKGTKVKNIRILEVPVADHDIDAKVDKFGPMHLKSSVVKKA